MVNPGGKLQPTGNITTGRTFALNGGALEVPAGVTLQYAGGGVTGGHIRGQGTHQLLAGASLSGTTALNGTAVYQTGPATLTNFTNGSALTSSAPLVWDGGSNTAAGNLTVNAAATVRFFDSVGVVTVNPGGVLTNAGSDLVLGGGSATFVGSAANPGGKIDLAGTTLQLRGGLLVNNGGNFASGNGVRGGPTVVDYGGLAKGNGFYESVTTKNGGVYSPGNSPGLGQVGNFTVNGGGTYLFEINDATGTSGPELPTTRGWDKTQVFTQLAFTATPASRFTIQLKTLLAPAGDVAGPMDHFDPHQSYTWLAFERMPGSTNSGAFDPSAINLVTAGVANPFDGMFSVVAVANGLAVQYTPVPEPRHLLAVLAAFAACWCGLARPRTS